MVAHWSVDMIEQLRAHPQNISVYTRGGLVDAYVRESLEKYRPELEGRVGIVIGTEKPWVEADILNVGAALVVTLEVRGDGREGGVKVGEGGEERWRSHKVAWRGQRAGSCVATCPTHTHTPAPVT